MNAGIDQPAWIWCDGAWVSEQDFRVDPDDRGLLHGLGAFETMRAEDGKLLRGNAHLERFCKAVATLGLASRDLANIQGIVRELCVLNDCQHGVARIRLTATAGTGALDSLSAGQNARCWLTAKSWCETANPVILGLLPWRKNSKSPLTGIKSSCYAENLLARRFAREQGWNEGIFLNENDAVCEAIMANVFAQIGDEILTPSLSSGCLPGVMRGEIVASGAARELPLAYADLCRADALWISSSLRGLVSVGMIDDIEKKVRPLCSW